MPHAPVSSKEFSGGVHRWHTTRTLRQMITTPALSPHAPMRVYPCLVQVRMYRLKAGQLRGVTVRVGAPDKRVRVWDRQVDAHRPS